MLSCATPAPHKLVSVSVYVTLHKLPLSSSRVWPPILYSGVFAQAQWALQHLGGRNAPPPCSRTGDPLFSSGSPLPPPLMQIALEAGCVDMKFTTMEWNSRAKDFYLRLGAHDTTESEKWHCMEFGKEALQRLARSGQGTRSK